MATKRKFVIDTDAGIDDAVALCMAMAAHLRGDIQIIAITTTHGNTTVDNVCVNVLRVLRAMKVTDIPVYKGSSTSLILPCETKDYYHGLDGFSDLNLPNPPDVSTIQGEHGVDALRRLVRENPDQITLVALGPLTNLAMVMRLEESFASNLKELFIMGGNTEGQGNVTASAEFNFYCDPEAAHIVLTSVKCPTYIIPWELCLKQTMIPYEWRENVLGNVVTPQAQLINAIEKKPLTRKKFSTWVSCDQLCMAIALNSNVATRVLRCHVTVEFHGMYTRGQMVVKRKQHHKQGVSGAITIVESVDVELYKKYLFWAMGHSDHGC